MDRTRMRSAAFACLLLVGVVVGQATACRAALTTGLQGYWQFNGNGLDSSGNGRDLTLVDNPGFAAGMFGDALDLHGVSSQYAVRPVVDSVFNFAANDFAIQVWVNFNTRDTREQTLIEQFTGSGGPGWTLTSPGFPDFFQFFPDSGPGGPVFNGGTINAGDWYHVIAERNGNIVSVFVNGNIVSGGILTSAITDSLNPLLIGRRNGGQQFALDGKIDDVAIWDRALTTDEISTLWNGGLGTPVINAVPEPASLAIWGIGALACVIAGCRGQKYAA